MCINLSFVAVKVLLIFVIAILRIGFFHTATTYVIFGKFSTTYFSYYSLPWEVVARHANVLYMLFFASCIHSLKKSQLETKRVRNK